MRSRTPFPGITSSRGHSVTSAGKGREDFTPGIEVYGARYTRVFSCQSGSWEFPLGLGKASTATSRKVFSHWAAKAGVRVSLPKNGRWGGGRGRTASKSPGPLAGVSLAVRCCMDCSGGIQGPPVPHHPGPTPMEIWIPQRLASRMACPNRSIHSGLMNATGPRGTWVFTSNMMAPPIPADCIASRSAVKPSRVRFPSMKYQ
ncbi:MAG: hypothetical protein EBT75_04695 [Proteobacteria bacterium]|nr:hypothetical protein [Pseudomonadota bacterium]